VVASSSVPDLYAVLQVHPGADSEVIDAAYRQLMMKYHPDVAGDDPRKVSLHHQRAKAINEAYAILRDPVRRRAYDETARVGPRSSPAGGPPPPTTQPPTDQQSSQPPPTPTYTEVAESAAAASPSGPLAALTAAFYLLPGPYEWEPESRGELLSVFLLPPLGVAGFALATGRLAPLIGRSMNATLVAAAVLLLLSLPTWRLLPRIALAGVPSLVLLSGNLDSALGQIHMPGWLAWGLLGTVSLILSARVFIFAVLPSMGVCWLLTRFS
jgi:hypothetical protein